MFVPTQLIMHRVRSRDLLLLFLDPAGPLTVPGSEEVDRQLVDPRAVHRHHAPTDLVELAGQVQQADRFIAATASSKLQLIVDHIRYLQEQVPRDRERER